MDCTKWVIEPERVKGVNLSAKKSRNTPEYAHI